MICDFGITVPREKSLDFNKMGNKAKELVTLKSRGFNVPGGFVLDSDTFDEIMCFNGLEQDMVACMETFKAMDYEGKKSDFIKKISHSLCALFDNIALPEDVVCKINTFVKEDKKYAVRSSSIKEDLEFHSFAGMYETYLDIEGRRGIKEAIIKCYRSLFSVNVLTYIADNCINIDDLKMAVVVQEMVPSKFSGVIFNVNPISGVDTEMVIDVVEGLGNNYVDGTTKPETYYYDWYKEEYRIKEGNKFLSRAVLDKLTKVALEIQKEYGKPCDIEYGIVDDEVYILQVRSITKIEHGVLDRVWTTANFRDGGVSSRVCHYMMYSLYEYVWENIMGAYLIKSRLCKRKEVPDRLIEMYYGRPYWDLTTVKTGISGTPGFKEREFDSEYAIEMDYEGDGLVTGYSPKSLVRGLKILGAQNRIVKKLNETIKDHIAMCMERYEEYHSVIDKELSSREIKDMWLKLVKEYYFEAETKYFWHVYVNTVEQSVNKNFFLKYVDEMEYLNLLGGMNDVSHMRSFGELWKISREVVSNEEVKSFFETHSSKQIAQSILGKDIDGPLKEISDSIQEYLDKYGYHSNKELNLTYPSFREQPSDVIHIIKDYMDLDENDSPISSKHDGYSVYRAGVKDVKSKTSRRTFKKFLLKLKKLRSMLWNREELKDISTRFYYLIRIYTIKLARLLVSQGALGDIDDIWHLELNDIYDLIELSDKIDNKQKVNKEAIVERIYAKVKKNKAYYMSYRAYENENEIGKVQGEDRPRKKKDDSSIRGVGCNAGVITATARVIHDVEELDRIKRGDILVAKYTDTGWTPKFAKLGGIVTEFGGILCHAAIVSREYGIPCVVCAHKAMKHIKDGDIITVDGKSGIVTVENKER